MQIKLKINDVEETTILTTEWETAEQIKNVINILYNSMSEPKPHVKAYVLDHSNMKVYPLFDSNKLKKENN